MLAAIKFSHTKNPSPGSPSQVRHVGPGRPRRHRALHPVARAVRQFGHLVVPDAIVAVRAVIDRRPGAEEVNLIVNELMPIEALAERFTSGMSIRVDERRHGIDMLTTLHEIVRGYPGNKTLRLQLALEDGSMAQLESGKRIDLNPELRRRIDELLGPGHTQPIGAPPKPTPAGQNGNGRGRRQFGG